ncbi:MAG: BamA/TamA family outer membrane protein [Gemmatimonadota bacterium]
MKRHVGLLVTLLGIATTSAHAQDSARVIRSLSFKGNHSIESSVLAAAIATTNSSWFARTPPFRWLGLGEKRTFDEQEFRRDVVRLGLFYKQSGFLEVQVDTVVHRTARDVSVKFVIKEGQPVRVTGFAITGIDSVRRPDLLMQDLPLRKGAPFNRFLFQASADSMVRRLQDHGWPSAEVFRNYTVNKDLRTATVSLDVAPGTEARYGSIKVVGQSRVDSSFILDLLAVRPGRLFSQSDLFQSQRNLYQTELFRFATVAIDSSRFQTDDSIVPIEVSVSEGRSHRVRSSVGFATEDCFRGGVGWTDRNLFRTGRLFDISAQVSKIGVGEPANFGLDRSICAAAKDDTIGSSHANYNVTALIRQPRFFSPNISGTYSLFAERRSEFNVYRREEIGGAISLTDQVLRRVPLTFGYRLGYGSTQASSGTLCAFFNACTPADIDRLRQKRVLALLSANAVWLRSNSPIDPTRGYSRSLEGVISSRFIGSSSLEQFLRVTADQAWYRQLGQGWVLSWHLRGGFILSPQVAFDSSSGNFIPPDQRYYAGGPNDVRGFARNELGPLVYVLQGDSISQAQQIAIQNGSLRPQFFATGGNTLAIGQIELRIPSPIFRQRLRLAAFLDAGTLFERGKTNFSPALIRVTPGVGLRFATPLGPVRFDVGYNPYPLTPGALYLQKSNGDLEFVQNDFTQPRTNHFTFHFSVGQPF